jgi:hypothetical protein
MLEKNYVFLPWLHTQSPSTKTNTYIYTYLTYEVIVAISPSQGK